jgi:hypothetical protein
MDMYNIDAYMYDAIERKDETLIKEILLKAMTFFLENEDQFSKEDLNHTASLYLLGPIHLGWEKEFDFKDRKLRYVLEELTIIEEKTDSRAKEVVMNCKLYLEGRDYRR